MPHDPQAAALEARLTRLDGEIRMLTALRGFHQVKFGIEFYDDAIMARLIKRLEVEREEIERGRRTFEKWAAWLIYEAEDQS